MLLGDAEGRSVNERSGERERERVSPGAGGHTSSRTCVYSCILDVEQIVARACDAPPCRFGIESEEGENEKRRWNKTRTLYRD